MDNVVINITEQIDDISITVVEQATNVDITVTQQTEEVNITATSQVEQVTVTVNQQVEQVTINISEGTGGAVDSVNGQTGVVVLTSGDFDHNALQNTHNLTTDINHNSLTNTHNLTTDIDHNQLTNTHNLTTDIDHNQLTNYAANRHFLESEISIPASQVSDFDTEVSNNTDVNNNTSSRHDAVTVTDTAEIDLTLTGQDIQASIKATSIDETKLDTSVNDSLNLADSATQPGDLGNLATLDTVGTSEIDTAAVTSNELADIIELDSLTYDVVEANLSTLTPSSSIAANFTSNSFLQVTLTVNTTITVSNLNVGPNTLWITQPAAFKTVGKTGWGTLVDNSDDVAEVNNAISIVQFIYNGTTILYTVLISGA